MKINLPVTQHEKELSDTAQIVSKTDLKGKITYINGDFIEVSGFTEEELLGKNHNIVRHPDMPPEAYAGLWATVNSGKPWIGIVKNRCKNGDHYWVEAVVTPVAENGQVVGFISVRHKASRQQIEGALRFHKFIKEGESRTQAVFSKIRSFRRNFTLRARIVSIFVTMAITSALLGAIGIVGIEDTNVAVKTLYNDRVVPLKQLKVVADMYAVNIVDTTHKVRNGNLTWEQGQTNVEVALKEVDKEWKAYTTTYLVEDEKKLISEAEPLFAKANKATDTLQSIFRTQNEDRLDTFATSELYPAIDPLSDKITALINLQLKVSSEVYADAQADYTLHSRGAIIVILLGLALTAWLGWLLYNAFMPRVRDAVRHLLASAKGVDYEPVARTGHRDELTDVMDSYRALSTRISFDHAEMMNGINLIKSALDNATIPVTVGSGDNILIYMNKAGFALWKEMAPELVKRHPDFSVDKMIGSKLGQYIENESDHEVYVTSTKKPNILQTKMAGRILKLSFNPVIDEKGKYLGRMIQWIDRTAEVDAEQKVAALISQTVAGDLTKRIDAASLPAGAMRDIIASAR